MIYIYLDGVVVVWHVFYKIEEREIDVTRERERERERETESALGCGVLLSACSDCVHYRCFTYTCI